MASSSGVRVDQQFDSFYKEVKEIEKRDSAWTSDGQLTRLLRPGAAYFNLNPFEVLQVDPDLTLEEMKKQYKKLSLLVHPDKNPNDRDRAKTAFELCKKAIESLEDPDEMDRCRQMIVEAKARLEIELREKRKEHKKRALPGGIDEDEEPEKMKRALWVMTCKVFADRERKKKTNEKRMTEESERMEKELRDLTELRRVEKEFAQNFEESRDLRMKSWTKFQGNEKKHKKIKIFRPPKSKQEVREANPVQDRLNSWDRKQMF